MVARDQLDDIGKLVLRLLVGGLMLFHGIDKIINGVGDVQRDLAEHGLPGILAFGVYVSEVIAPLFIIGGVWTRLWAVVCAAGLMSQSSSCTRATSFTSRQPEAGQRNSTFSTRWAESPWRCSGQAGTQLGTGRVCGNPAHEPHRRKAAVRFRSLRHPFLLRVARLRWPPA